MAKLDFGISAFPQTTCVWWSVIIIQPTHRPAGSVYGVALEESNPPQPYSAHYSSHCLHIWLHNIPFLGNLSSWSYCDKRQIFWAISSGQPFSNLTVTCLAFNFCHRIFSNQPQDDDAQDDDAGETIVFNIFTQFTTTRSDSNADMVCFSPKKQKSSVVFLSHKIQKNPVFTKNTEIICFHKKE